MTRSCWLAALVLVAACGDDTAPPTGDASDAGERLVDPLSMPAEPTHDIADFRPADSCNHCHQTHYQQWQESMHAYAMIDPVFRALVEARQRDLDGAQDAFCTQCHSAIGTRGGDVVPGFAFDELSELSLEGVTCEACHKVASIERRYNSGHVLDATGPIRGPIEDPIDNGFHDSAHSSDFDTADFCGGCHDVLEVGGLSLERPFQEWLESPAAEQGDTCQSCHMPSYRGRATDDAPERDLHSHRFVGVDVPLADDFVSDEEREALRGPVRELLEGCATVELSAAASARAGDQLDLLVTVENHISGHDFPTGSSFNRQAWLEIVATDAEGQVVYRTGDLDDNGDLKNVFSELDAYGDPDLISFHSTMVDAAGVPEIFPWRAAEHFRNSIAPEYARSFTLFIPTDAAAEGELEITARLRFRTHAPFILRALGLDALTERLEIYDVAEDAIQVQVTPPDAA